jgi:hypothetical protein
MTVSKFAAGLGNADIPDEYLVDPQPVSHTSQHSCLHVSHRESGCSNSVAAQVMSNYSCSIDTSGKLVARLPDNTTACGRLWISGVDRQVSQMPCVGLCSCLHSWITRMHTNAIWRITTRLCGQQHAHSKHMHLAFMHAPTDRLWVVLAQASRLKGGLDGTYTLESCHDGRPLYRRQSSPAGT